MIGSMKYTLINQIIFAGQTLYPGKLIDDSQFDIALLQAAGARLTSDSSLDAQASFARNLREQGRIQSLSGLDEAGGKVYVADADSTALLSDPFGGSHVSGYVSPSMFNEPLVDFELDYIKIRIGNGSPPLSQLYTYDLTIGGTSLISGPIVLHTGDTYDPEPDVQGIILQENQQLALEVDWDYPTGVHSQPLRFAMFVKASPII